MRRRPCQGTGQRPRRKRWVSLRSAACQADGGSGSADCARVACHCPPRVAQDGGPRGCPWEAGRCEVTGTATHSVPRGHSWHSTRARHASRDSLQLRSAALLLSGPQGAEEGGGELRRPGAAAAAAAAARRRPRGAGDWRGQRHRTRDRRATGERRRARRDQRPAATLGGSHHRRRYGRVLLCSPPAAVAAAASAAPLCRPRRRCCPAALRLAPTEQRAFAHPLSGASKPALRARLPRIRLALSVFFGWRARRPCGADRGARARDWRGGHGAQSPSRGHAVPRSPALKSVSTRLTSGTVSMRVF